MGVVMGITAVVLGIAAGILGLIVWTALFFPASTARAGIALQGRPLRCLGLGVLLAGVIGVPVVVLLHATHGLAKLAGWAMLLPLVAVLLVGLTAMAHVMGERLQTLSPAMTPLGGLVRGALTLELAMLPPFVGWFLFAPLVGLTTLGAGAMGCAGRVSQPTPSVVGDPDLGVDTGTDGRRPTSGQPWELAEPGMDRSSVSAIEG